MYQPDSLDDFNSAFDQDWTEHLEIEVTGADSDIKSDVCMGVMKFTT